MLLFLGPGNEQLCHEGWWSAGIQPSFASSDAQGTDELLSVFFCLGRLHFTFITLLVIVLGHIPFKKGVFYVITPIFNF